MRFSVGNSGSGFTIEGRRGNDENGEDVDDDDDDTGSTISSAASSTVGHSSSKTIAATSGFNNVGFASMKRVDMYYDTEDVSTATTNHTASQKYADEGEDHIMQMMHDDDVLLPNATNPPHIRGSSRNRNHHVDGGLGSCCSSSSGDSVSYPMASPITSTTGALRGGAHDDLLHTPPIFQPSCGGAGGNGSSLRRSNSASMTMFGQGAINIEAARMRKAALRPTIDLASIAQRQQKQ